jgi:hypothetical protein
MSGGLATVAAWLTVAALAAGHVAALENPPPRPRVLFIAIDAVPFAIMEEAAADPASSFLAGLKGPVPLVSTFPSATSLALAALLHPIGVPPSPGYEAKHYSWAENRVSGGGLTDYEPFPWRSFFDWKVHTLWRKATSAIRPIKASKKDIRESIEAFRASSEPIYFVYYDTTDSGGHLKGPRSLLTILAELDRQLDALRREHPEEPFWTVIFSDHGLDGGPALRNVRADVKSALSAAGFGLRQKLEDDGDIVIIPFGLVSSLVAYTRPGREEDAARAMASAEGVDLCAARIADGYLVESSRGRAIIHRLPSDPPRWRYEWSGDEDPLSLGADLAAVLAGEDGLDDGTLFARTLPLVYPDPFHRIASSFDGVDNPASVVCSVARGYMFGAKITELGSLVSVGRLRWTHGALEREASLGFLMSDVPSWKALGPVRFDHALEAFNDLWDGRVLRAAE